MPVNFEAYRDDAAKEGLPFDPDTHAYTILSFLGEHPETGFKPAEIADETNITPGSVRGTLHRLEDRGLVRHAEPFWAIGDGSRP
jgi:DNA-binding IclR family transcriptional regulator